MFENGAIRSPRELVCMWSLCGEADLRHAIVIEALASPSFKLYLPKSKRAALLRQNSQTFTNCWNAPMSRTTSATREVSEAKFLYRTEEVLT